MTVTVGVVANVYCEANALPGWLEAHTAWADWVGVMHAGPQGQHSEDGTVEILERWRVPTQFCAIDDGFGAVRTATVGMCPCDYAVLLDADERVYRAGRVLACVGEGTPQSEVDAILQTYDFRDVRTVLPNWENVARLGAGLRVEVGEAVDQERWLRYLLDHERPDALACRRRHWHDLGMTKPTQNWDTDPDWQLRVVKCKSDVSFDPKTRMHERLFRARRVSQTSSPVGPFFDHFHFHFKKMEVAQRAHDIAVYNAVHEGKTPPTWREFWEAKQ
jgi:hypothetical protein